MLKLCQTLSLNYNYVCPIKLLIVSFTSFFFALQKPLRHTYLCNSSNFYQIIEYTAADDLVEILSLNIKMVKKLKELFNKLRNGRLRQIKHTFGFYHFVYINI